MNVISLQNRPQIPLRFGGKQPPKTVSVSHDLSSQYLNPETAPVIVIKNEKDPKDIRMYAANLGVSPEQRFYVIREYDGSRLIADYKINWITGALSLGEQLAAQRQTAPSNVTDEDVQKAQTLEVDFKTGVFGFNGLYEDDHVPAWLIQRTIPGEMTLFKKTQLMMDQLLQAHLERQ